MLHINKSLLKFVIAILFFSAITIVGCFFLRAVDQSQLQFFFFRDGVLQMSDFAYHLVIVDAFWFKNITNIYQPSVQEAIISTFVGGKISGAMPLGITPMALVIWFPFAVISHLNFACANISWVIFSLIFFTAGVLTCLKYSVSRPRIVFLRTVAVIAVCIFSTTMVRSIVLGQTSIIATGALMLILGISRSLGENHEDHRGSLFTLAALIFIVAIKPPYLVLGILILLLFGLWREILISLGLLSITVVLLTVRLGSHWVKDYALSLGTYAANVVPTQYQFSIVPNTMNIFRTAFRDTFGEALAMTISITVFVAGFVWIFAFVLLAHIRHKEGILIRNHSVYITLAIACYLLFSPYAGQYEDLLLILPITLIFGLTTDRFTLRTLEQYILILLSAVVLNFNLLSKVSPLWMLWSIKAVVLISIPLMLRRSLSIYQTPERQ